MREKIKMITKAREVINASLVTELWKPGREGIMHMLIKRGMKMSKGKASKQGLRLGLMVNLSCGMASSIHIYGNVPSSKNSRKIVHPKSRTGLRKRVKVIRSTIVQKYTKNTDMQWALHAPIFRRMADAYKFRVGMKNVVLPVTFLFIRDSKRRFDYINALQIVQDQMVAYGWIDDDNADELLPVFLPYEVDPKNAGVIISIINE